MFICAYIKNINSVAFSVMGSSHFDPEDGGGPLEIFSRTTGGPFAMN
jgi:hypothetical protein